MHDPMTLAFDIYLGKARKKNGKYKDPIITIWHVDPEKDGTDDSCGWSFPRITKEEKDWLHKVAMDQYSQLFARKEALKKEKSYAYICYNQKSKITWQYGKYLSNKELQYCYQLATDPVDNFQHHNCNTIEEFEEMVFLIYRCWKKYKRKWYQHPKWHIHHWKIQFNNPFKFRKKQHLQKTGTVYENNS